MMTPCYDGNSFLARALCQLGIAVCLLVIGKAHAQSAEGVRPVASQALFEEARQLMQVGRFAEACPKLAESQRLEPAAGTLLNLAVCHEKEGKTATAWLEYNDAVALAVRAGDNARKDIATERIEVLEPLLSRLTLLLPKNAPKDLWIELDDVRLGPVAWATGVPVDPHSHVIRAGAEGKITATITFGVDRTNTAVRLQLPELADNPLPIPAAARSPVLAHRRNSPQFRSALEGVTLGVGISGLIAATYFGLHAKSEWDVRNQHCRSGCDEQAVMAGRNAKSAALLSTISSGVALLGLGFATYLFVTSPHDDETRVRLHIEGELAVGHALLSAAGEF